MRRHTRHPGRAGHADVAMQLHVPRSAHSQSRLHPPTEPPTRPEISLDMQGSIRTLLTALRSTVAIPPQVEEAMRMVPRSLFLPPGQAALAWQARPVLPSGHSIILGSPQAEALALQVRNVFAVWAYRSSTRQLHMHVLLTKRAKMLSMHDVLPGSIYAG